MLSLLLGTAASPAAHEMSRHMGGWPMAMAETTGAESLAQTQMHNGVFTATPAQKQCIRDFHAKWAKNPMYLGRNNPCGSGKRGGRPGTCHAGSQFHEDLIMIPYLLHFTGGKPGTFVEIGGFDGLTYSNTVLLEKCFGWKGLLIEGNPQNFANLQKNVKMAGRTNVKSKWNAVCNGKGPFNNGTIPFTVAGGLTAGNPNDMSDDYKAHWAGRDGLSGKKTGEATVVAVPCKEMTKIMTDAGQPTADFLSLDVEGAEADVLKASNIKAFKVVVVESDGDNPPKDAEVDRMLKAAGLIKMEWKSQHVKGKYNKGLGKIGPNDIYIHPSLVAKMEEVVKKASWWPILDPPTFVDVE